MTCGAIHRGVGGGSGVVSLCHLFASSMHNLREGLGWGGGGGLTNSIKFVARNGINCMREVANLHFVTRS